MLNFRCRNRTAGLEAAGGEEPASPALDLKSSGVATPKTGSKLESALDKLGLQKRKVCTLILLSHSLYHT